MKHSEELFKGGTWKLKKTKQYKNSRLIAHQQEYKSSRSPDDSFYVDPCQVYPLKLLNFIFQVVLPSNNSCVVLKREVVKFS